MLGAILCNAPFILGAIIGGPNNLDTEKKPEIDPIIIQEQSIQKSPQTIQTKQDKNMKFVRIKAKPYKIKK